MNFSKKITLLLAGTLLLNISCRNDEPVEIEVPKGQYENGILVANEGNFNKPNASVSFISNDLSRVENNIFANNNSNTALGDVLQSIGLHGDLAYFVVNNSNKIEVANRYTLKKSATITSNLDNPRYISFAGNNSYVTNNNFFDTFKVTVFNSSLSHLKTIPFERYAENIVSSDGFIFVQSDGVTYDANYNELPTGHTISRINTATNEVDKTITLTDPAPIRAMTADQSFTYVLTSDFSDSYLYKITSKSGTFEQVKLAGISSANFLTIDNGKMYFLSGNKVYAINGNSATLLFEVDATYVYGLNVINGNVFVSDASFTEDSTVKIYDLTGKLLKSVKTGIGTNGFYKN